MESHRNASADVRSRTRIILWSICRRRASRGDSCWNSAAAWRHALRAAGQDGCWPVAASPRSAAASCRQGQARRAALHVRRRQPVRHVRLQAGARQAARREVRPGRAGRAVPVGARQGDEVAVRAGGSTASAASGSASRVAPLGECVDDIAFIHSMVVEVERPRPGHVHAGHRLRAAGLPQHGRVDQLRPGQPERRPADVRRPARPARLRAERPDELGVRLSAGRAPGHDGPAQRAERRSPTCSRPTAAYVNAASDADGLAVLRELNREHAVDPRRATRGSTPASAPTSWPPGCSSARRKCSTFAASPSTSCKMYGLDTRQHDHAGQSGDRHGAGDRILRPQLPRRPAAAGARRAVRAGLERRRQRLPAPQLGLARRPRARPRPARPPGLASAPRR